MDAIEKAKLMEHRAMQAKEGQKAGRAKIWKEIQQQHPDFAGHLKQISCIFGKPAQTKIWIGGHLVWPSDDSETS